MEKNNIMNENNKPHYSDMELLNFLEENNFETSYTNLCILKEGLESGEITIEDDEIPEEIPSVEEVPVEEPSETEEENSDEIPEEIPAVDGSAPAPFVPVQPTLLEKRYVFRNKIVDDTLRAYLVEKCNLSEKDYNILTEDTKTDSLKQIAINLLSGIEEKLASIDTSIADRSRGDIKQLRELQMLQDCITKLETIIERDENAIPEYNEVISVVIKSILYINQYSSTFKDAYRNKKTIMILKYQSLILSIISTVTYLMSVIVDYSNNGIRLKKLPQEEISNFAPLNCLRDFIKSVDNGEFKMITKDVSTLREYYLEVPVEKMGAILEAYDYVPMIIDGVKNIYNQLVNGEFGNKISNILYNAIGVVTLLFSLRDTFYTLFRMKTRISDMLGVMQNFANINNGGNIISKINQFVNKFKVDAEYGSDISKREIEDEDKKILNQVKQVQNSNMSITSKPVETIQTKQPETNPIDFAFDF